MVLSEIKSWLAQDKIRQASVLVGAVILLVTFSVALKSCYEHRIISEHETQVKAEALEKKADADSKAAEARASDTITLQKKDEDRKDAIAKATDEAPSAPERNLGCERLRQAGYNTSRIPACQ